MIDSDVVSLILSRGTVWLISKGGDRDKYLERAKLDIYDQSHQNDRFTNTCRNRGNLHII